MVKKDGKKIKKVIEKKGPALKKEVRSNPHSYDKGKFQWKMERGIIDIESKWGWHNIDGKKFFCDVLKKLHDNETMSWAKLKGGDSHSIEPSQLCGEAQKILKKRFNGDLPGDTLFSLRITGKQRIWGFLDQGILKLLWWDPEHKVYPVDKN